MKVIINKYKKTLVYSIAAILIMAAAILGVHNIQVNAASIYQLVSLVPAENKNNKNIMSVKYSSNGSFYNLDYQDAVYKRIEEQKSKKSYSIYNPLLILNPYGTNTCSINMYFNTKEKVYAKYRITVKDKNIKDFSATLNNGKADHLTNDHAYQITGLVPGMENTVYVTVYKESGAKAATLKFNVTMPKLKSGIETRVEKVEDGKSKQKLSEGLYAMMGHDKAFESNIYLYDNYGTLRGEIPLIGYRTDRIERIGDDILFSYSDHDIARMNRQGRLLAKYKFEGYTMHHDFVYDEKAGKIFILVTEDNTKVVEDVIISVDIKTSKVTKILDFKDYLPEAYKKSAATHKTRQAADKTIGDLDWIHFNTIQSVDGKDLILSAREFSTIIRINDVLAKPYVKYLIADESVWEGTAYEKLVYKKDGNFVAQAGQHTVTYEPDSSLKKGQYYLSMFNNNYAGASSRPDFDWSNYPGTGSFEKGTNSYYYKYLVDENAKTFKLVEHFPVPYSSIVSSTQDMGDTYVVSSGKSNNYGEYDKEGTLIRQFSYDATKYSYRVFKYSFKDFWFY